MLTPIPLMKDDQDHSESTIDAAVAGAGEGGISGFFDEADMDFLMQLPDTMAMHEMARQSK